MHPLKFKYTAPRLDLLAFPLFLHVPFHCLLSQWPLSSPLRWTKLSILGRKLCASQGQLRDPRPELLGASRWTPRL